MEESGGLRRGEQRMHARRSGGLAENRDVARVPAECADIASHPIEGGDLIVKSIVSRAAFGLSRQRRQREITKSAKAIVDRNEHDAAPGKLGPVIARHVAGAATQPAAVDPDHHRPVGLGWRPGGPDIEVEAVFAHLERLAVSPAAWLALHACGGELCRFKHARPGLGSAGQLPP